MSGVELFQIWLVAFATLALFSFMYKDNPFYRVAEHVFTGLSAGYYIGLTWDTIIVTQLWNPMMSGRWWLFIPGILSLLMFTRLSPRFSWVSRTSLAFVMGVTAGGALVFQLHGLVLAQTQSTMVPIQHEISRTVQAYDHGPSVLEIAGEAVDSPSLAFDTAAVDSATELAAGSEPLVHRISGDSVFLSATLRDSALQDADNIRVWVSIRNRESMDTVLLADSARLGTGGVEVVDQGGDSLNLAFRGIIDSTLPAGSYEVEIEARLYDTLVILTLIMIIGVISTLIYFYYSKEHKGVLGVTARVGIWFIMVSFGAHFGFTVMGRVSLLIERVQFLIEDWIGSFV